jgi:ATP-dependent Clp protease ATP-binding subunit ClpA
MSERFLNKAIDALDEAGSRVHINIEVPKQILISNVN